MKRVYYGDSTRAYADSVFRARELAEGSTLDPEARGFLLPIPPPWPILPGLVTRQVDNRSGLLASRWCPADSAYTELYLPGTEPTELCDQSGFRIRRPPGTR